MKIRTWAQPGKWGTVLEVAKFAFLLHFHAILVNFWAKCQKSVKRLVVFLRGGHLNVMSNEGNFCPITLHFGEKVMALPLQSPKK